MGYEIFQFIILILIIMVIIIYIPFLYIIIKNYFVYQTRINSLLLRITFCFGFAYTYDFLRVGFFIFNWYLYPFADLTGYCVKYMLFLIGFYYEARLISILNKNSGNEMKFENIRKTIHLVFIGCFFAICLLTIKQTEVSPSGLYTFAPSVGLFLPMTIFFGIVSTILVFMAAKLVLNTKEKEVKKRVIITVLFFGFLTLINYLNIRNFILFPYDYPYILFFISYILILLGCLLFASLKFKGLLEVLNLYFNIDSLYVISEKGEFILSHDFKEMDSEEVHTSRKEMLGGFIYAITRGVGLALKIDAKVNLLDFGDLKLVIEQGKYTYVVLLINEYSPIFEEKIIKIVNEIENSFESDLKTINKEISEQKKEEILKLIYNLLR